LRPRVPNLWSTRLSGAGAPRIARLTYANGRMAWWGVTASVQQHERNETMLYLGKPG